MPLLFLSILQCCQNVATRTFQSSITQCLCGLSAFLVLFPLAKQKQTLTDFVLAFWFNLITFVLDYPNCIGYPNFCYHLAITKCYHQSSNCDVLFIITYFDLFFNSLNQIAESVISPCYLV